MQKKKRFSLNCTGRTARQGALFLFVPKKTVRHQKFMFSVSQFHFQVAYSKHISVYDITAFIYSICRFTCFIIMAFNCFIALTVCLNK